MKNIIVIIFSILLLSFASTAHTQTSTGKKDKKISTEYIDVEGTCGMCKKRIEKAAYINGVKRVNWDKETKKLEVIYNPKIVTLEQIAQEVAKVGHDAYGIKADHETYESLPNCCAYRSGATCTH